MKTYIDSEYIILNDVLLMASGTNEWIEIPGSVRAIGKGAGMNLDCMKHVKIPEGVERIGREAFAYNRELEGVELPGSFMQCEDEVFAGCDKLKTVTGTRILSEKSYQYLKNVSVGEGDVLTVVSGITRMEEFAPVWHTLEELAKPVYEIPRKIKHIYLAKHPDMAIDDYKLWNLQKGQYIDTMQENSEEAFSGEKEVRAIRVMFARADAWNDSFTRLECEPEYQKSILLTYNKNEVVACPDGYQVHFQLWIGYPFIINYDYVRLNNRDYYVKNYNFLGTKKGSEVIRKCVGVVNEFGTVINGEESDLVMQKYQFLMMM